jgi:uncharacterized protein YktA (UPF0223 family)
MKEFLSILSESYVKENSLQTISDSMFYTYRVWRELTNNGEIPITNMPATVSKTFNEIKQKYDKGLDFNSIAQSIKRDAELTPAEKAQETNKANRYLDQNPVDVGDAVYDLHSQTNPTYKDIVLNNLDIKGGEQYLSTKGFSPMFPKSWYQKFIAEPLGKVPFMQFGPQSYIEAGFNKIAAVSLDPSVEKEFRKYHKVAFENAVYYGDSEEDLEQKSKAAQYTALEKMQNDGYSLTLFMGPDDEYSFKKYGVEGIFQGSARDLKNTIAGYALSQIVKYEEAGQTDLLASYGFVDEDGNYKRPTLKQMSKLTEKGNFYLEWDGNPVMDASEVRYNLVYQNYQDLERRPSDITSNPVFQFNPDDKFEPNKYTNIIDMEKVKESAANKMTGKPADAEEQAELIQRMEDGDFYKGSFDLSVGGKKVNQFIIDTYDFINKIIPGERRNIFDRKFIEKISEYENNIMEEKAKAYRDTYKGFSYETDADKINLFRLMHYNATNSLTEFDTDKAMKVMENVSQDRQIQMYPGYLQALISESIFATKGINEKDFIKAIKNKNFKKIKKLVGDERESALEIGLTQKDLDIFE